MVQLPAMTLSVDTIQGMADAMGDDPETAAADTLTAAVGGEALEEGLTEPERAIKDRLQEPVRRACPDSADAILR